MEEYSSMLYENSKYATMIMQTVSMGICSMIAVSIGIDKVKHKVKQEYQLVITDQHEKQIV